MGEQTSKQAEESQRERERRRRIAGDRERPCVRACMRVLYPLLALLPSLSHSPHRHSLLSFPFLLLSTSPPFPSPSCFTISRLSQRCSTKFGCHVASPPSIRKLLPPPSSLSPLPPSFPPRSTPLLHHALRLSLLSLPFLLSLALFFSVFLSPLWFSLSSSPSFPQASLSFPPLLYLSFSLPSVLTPAMLFPPLPFLYYPLFSPFSPSSCSLSLLLLRSPFFLLSSLLLPSHPGLSPLSHPPLPPFPFPPPHPSVLSELNSTVFLFRSSRSSLSSFTSYPPPPSLPSSPPLPPSSPLSSSRDPSPTLSSHLFLLLRSILFFLHFFVSSSSSPPSLRPFFFSPSSPAPFFFLFSLLPLFPPSSFSSPSSHLFSFPLLHLFSPPPPPLLIFCRGRCILQEVHAGKSFCC
ncbi:hypothetical protein C7M84_014745 [Penaeus vannamei]|uniref:Uncharacterized protein n=1 Tax=Penaeus vannamei TaxID=6689 RepID=A0A423SSL1_PENVA|nr:hypothetical protein C7M84_014745 [Penaeus vannamei]